MTEWMLNFHFLRPYWLLLLVISFFLGLLLWKNRGSEPSWIRVVSPDLLPHLISASSIKRSRSGVPALLGAWCLAIFAAAGPSWEQLPQPVMQKQDALVLAVDLSYSMLATDLQPSRQDRVRRKLLDLLRDRREGLTALIAYAGDAHVVAPLTDDNPTIANLLPALTPQMMPLPGSNPVEAIQRALALLDSAGVTGGRILLVTDGLTDRDATLIARQLEGGQRQLAVLGVGTAVGAPITLPSGGFLKDEAGEIVVPALDEVPLKAVARLSGGRYEKIRVDDSDLQALLADDLLIDQGDTVSRDRRADQWQDMAHWFVLPLLIIALAAFRRGWVYLLPFAILIFPAKETQALEWQDLWLRADQQGQQALAAGSPERAAELFKDPAWRGKAAYEGELYEDAENAFRNTGDADSWYNLGNALAGQNKLDEAIDAYKRSLAMQPDQEDALQNIDALEQAKEQQQQQQDEQDQQGDPNQQSQDNESQEQRDGDSGSQQDPNAQQQSNDPGESQNQDSESQNSGNNEQQNQQEQQDGQPSESQDEGSQGDSEQSEEAAGQPMPQPEIDNSAMQEDMEKDQAMQQWLRRVPDDPSGLLREKFRYESRLRQQQGKSRETKQIW